MFAIIIDDHQMIAQAIKNSLLSQKIIHEIDVYSSAQGFFDSFNNNGVKKIPDLIITDLLMPGISGIELLKVYQDFFKKNNNNHYKLIVLSTISDPLTVRMAIRYGADGYLTKESSIEELIDAINECLSGNKFICKNLREDIVNAYFTDEQIIYHLSPREKDVLKLICSGKTIKEAASDMNLSAHTVKSYYKNIMKKFNVNRTADLIVFAMKNGFFLP